MSNDPGDTNDNRRDVPTFGRGTCVYLGLLTGDPVSGEDHDLSVYASFDEHSGFELTTHDGGHWPVDELHTALWVEPGHVHDLLLALGRNSGDDPVELLAQKIKNGSIPVKEGGPIEGICIDRWFSENGVQYTTDSKRVSNL
jgi:hypothetical protein